MNANKIVIIPTYNEAGTIRDLIKEIFRFCPDTDILVVDDNSPDGTGEIVEKSAQADKRIRCLHRQKKEGIGRAYAAAFKEIIKEDYAYIAQMDADFSHKPEYVPHMFELAAEYDVVIGSRYVNGGQIENWGVLRRLVSRCGSFYAKVILGLPVNDLTGGFKCFRKSVLEKMDVDKILTRGYAFQIETTFRAYRQGARIKEFPIVFSERRAGKTKMSGSIVLEAVLTVPKLRMRIKRRK